MLTDFEKKKCQKVLQFLSDEDIFALMRTTTNNAVIALKRRDAETAILNFTQTLDEFFKRRKISRDVLIHYIFKMGWDAPKDRDLKVLRTFIIRKWKEEDPLESSSNKTSPAAPQPDLIDLTNDSEPEKVPTSSSSPTASQSNAAWRSSPPHSVSQESSGHPRQVVTHNNNKTVYNITNYTVNYNYQMSPSSNNNTSNCDNDFNQARLFVQWFFSLLNSHNPDTAEPCGDFGPKHFIVNVQLRLEMMTADTKIEHTVQGNEAVAWKLLVFPTEDRLLFSPSTSREGLDVKSDMFGRKVILVSGLVHKHGCCVGAFRQSFGLIADPMSQGTWKIAVTLLRMIEGVGFSVPPVCDDLEASDIGNQTASALSTY